MQDAWYLFIIAVLLLLLVAEWRGLFASFLRKRKGNSSATSSEQVSEAPVTSSDSAPSRKPVADDDSGITSDRLERFRRELCEITGQLREDVFQQHEDLQKIYKLLKDDANIPNREILQEEISRVALRIENTHEKLQFRLISTEFRLYRQLNEVKAHLEDAFSDPLTELPNRRMLERELGTSFDQWEKEGDIYSLCMFDLDQFKQLNDKHGHSTGDYVLRQFTEVMRRTSRDTDFIARIGGDEFVAILPLARVDMACAAAQRIRKAVDEYDFFICGERVELTVSVGIASILPDESSDTLMKRCDEALYAAKKKGGNCAVFHDGEDTLEIEEVLARMATTNDELGKLQVV